MKKYNLPLMILGGGGYTIRNVARCWTYETAVALNVEIANELPYNDYFEYFGPDFKLHISPSNMTNQNTPEYLDKIKNRLFENLRMLPHAPGVQMANIPEDGVTLKEESEAADEADPDKRNPPQLKDKQIEPDNEFEDAPGKSGNRDETSGKDLLSSGEASLKKESEKSGSKDQAASNAEEPMDVDEAKPVEKPVEKPVDKPVTASTWIFFLYRIRFGLQAWYYYIKCSRKMFDFFKTNQITYNLNWTMIEI